MLRVSQDAIAPGTPTAVTFHADLSAADPVLVVLAQAGAGILAGMHDDGLGGDELAGDRVFAATVVLDEPTGGTLEFFAAVLTERRVLSTRLLWWEFSGTAGVEVRNRDRIYTSSTGFQFRYPVGWIISEEDGRVAMESGPRYLVRIGSGQVDTPPEISIQVFPNPRRFTAAEFAANHAPGWYEHYRVGHEITIAGNPALRFSDAGEVLSLQPVVAVFIRGQKSVALCTLNDPWTALTAEQENVLNYVMSTLEF